MATRDDDDIDAWVDRLARPGPGDGEAGTLRRAIEAHAARQPAAPRDDDAAWQQLRFRLRRERLVVAGRPAWQRWVPTAAVAALALAVALPLLLPSGDPDIAVQHDAPPVLRGAGGVQEIAVADPATSARRAAALLEPQEARPAVYVHEGRASVDFEVDADRLEQVQSTLRREWPAVVLRPGLNRLVFRPRG